MNDMADKSWIHAQAIKQRRGGFMAKRAEDLMSRFEKHFIPEPNSGCWLWTACVDHSGYGRFGVDGKDRGAHRIAWHLYFGEIPDGFSVLHKCDVPSCVNPAHLFLGTQLENVLDMWRKGRRGSLCTLKLTTEQVELIRKSSEAASTLARRLNVSSNTIWDIRAGRRRMHI